MEIELSQQRHEGDLKEKNRLARMLDNKVISLFTSVLCKHDPSIKLFVI